MAGRMAGSGQNRGMKLQDEVVNYEDKVWNLWLDG